MTMKWIKFSSLLLLLSLTVWSATQTAPLTLAQVLTGLQTQGTTPETRTLTARNRFIAQRIRERGVTFRLTLEFESELRNAGASDELLKAIRENSPAKPVPPAPKPAESDRIVLPNSFFENLNGVSLEMIQVPAGKFTMGSDKYDDEKPPHQVSVPSFYIGKYEVTQKQWKAVMGNNPSYFFRGDDLPVEQVSWHDAQAFCKKLQAVTGKAHRLPSEAEWEYACRAGTTGDYAGKLDEMGWYGNNSGTKVINAYDIWFNETKKDKGKYDKRLIDNRCRTHQVGQKKPNALGLYDMHGNVWEWCDDVWHDNYGNNSPEDGSAWMDGGNSRFRVLRGGSWNLNDFNSRSALRYSGDPGDGFSDIGFRVVASARTQ